MACPVCTSNNIGQIGRERFYCEECCHEWVEKNGKVTVFKILGDGKLLKLRLHPIKEREVIGNG